MSIRVMASRHSAFYSPLLCAVQFLRDEGRDVPYSVLRPGQRSHVLLSEGVVDVMQSAVSSNWSAQDEGIRDLPIHFAQINRRDGFFLAGRHPDPAFDWRNLEGRSLLADHGLQPLAMLKYAVHYNGADWSRIRLRDAGSPEEMERVFRAGQADYVHLQSPAAHMVEREGAGHVVVSVGVAMPAVAFSSLCASAGFLRTETAASFLAAYRRARQWVRETPAEAVAAQEAEFFPGVAADTLAIAVATYQKLGCWEGEIGIPADLYEQALNVFEFSQLISRRHSYEEVARAMTAR